MSLGSSDMAVGALGAAFSLLLLASITQGLQDVEVFHYEEVEAEVGKDATLPCTLKNKADLKIVHIEWSKNKNENTKLAIYNPAFGLNLVWPNITIQIQQNSGSYLHLSKVSKWDAGTYFCDLTTFPLGTIRRETTLKIKDAVIEILCDVNGTVEVQTGENVTIHCRAFPNTQYKWTKNKMLVSENESLALWRVTDAHTGVYTLTVNTGNKSLHREFIIIVRTETTSLRTDLATASPQLNVTTSPTTGLSKTDVPWTTSAGTDVTDDSPNPSNVTAGERTTSFTNQTHTSVTSSPAAHTDPYRLNNSSYQEINRTLNTSNFSEQSVVSNLSTTLSYDSAVFRSTQETKSTGHITENSDNTGATTPKTGNTWKNNEDTGTVRTHLVLITIPILLLIAVAAVLCRREMIKQRMDLPPPFKPPPPPVKYTTARQREPFPTSRCNSVTELQDMI